MEINRRLFPPSVSLSIQSHFKIAKQSLAEHHHTHTIECIVCSFLPRAMLWYGICVWGFVIPRRKQNQTELRVYQLHIQVRMCICWIEIEKFARMYVQGIRSRTLSLSFLAVCYPFGHPHRQNKILHMERWNGDAYEIESYFLNYQKSNDIASNFRCIFIFHSSSRIVIGRSCSGGGNGASGQSIHVTKIISIHTTGQSTWKRKKERLLYAAIYIYYVVIWFRLLFHCSSIFVCSTFIIILCACTMYVHLPQTIRIYLEIRWYWIFLCAVCATLTLVEMTNTNRKNTCTTSLIRTHFTETTTTKNGVLRAPSVWKMNGERGTLLLLFFYLSVNHQALFLAYKPCTVRVCKGCVTWFPLK